MRVVSSVLHPCGYEHVAPFWVLRLRPHNREMWGLAARVGGRIVSPIISLCFFHMHYPWTISNHRVSIDNQYNQTRDGNGSVLEGTHADIVFPAHRYPSPGC